MATIFTFIMKSGSTVRAASRSSIGKLNFGGKNICVFWRFSYPRPGKSRLDIGDGKDVNLEKCPRLKLQHQCIQYLGPVRSPIPIMISLDHDHLDHDLDWWILM